MAKPTKNRGQLGLKPKQETIKEFRDLIEASQPHPTQEAMFEFLVHTAWLQLQRARSEGTEPEAQK